MPSDENQSDLVKSYKCEPFDLNTLPKRLPAWVAWLAFAVGFTGAVSLRLILVAKAYKPELIRLFWYLGVVGNMLFFLFRAYITHRRKRLILGLNLLQKLEPGQTLCPQDYHALRYVLSSLVTSKEMWNYAIIFVFSVLAILWDIWFEAR
ncbi:MAG: hypothetical protein ABWK15_02870 [Dissulfuribacterales bacterium]